MINHPNRNRPQDISAAKAAEIASALERAAKEIAKAANMLSRGFGDSRTPDFSIAIGNIAASARSWSKVMWRITDEKKHEKERVEG